MDDAKRISREFVVPNDLGLHVRPITLLVKTISKFHATVKVHRGKEEVDGRSVMGLLCMAAGKGEKLQFTAHGDDAAATLAAIEALFKAHFNEE